MIFSLHLLNVAYSIETHETVIIIITIIKRNITQKKNAFQSFYTNIYIDSHRYSSFCSILSPSRVIEILHKIRFTRSSAFSSTSCQSDKGSLDDKDIDDDDDDDDDTAVSDNALTLSSRSEY